MGDLTKYAQPQKVLDLDRAIQKRRRPGWRVPRWPLIALGLLVGGIIGHLVTSNWSLPEIERLITEMVPDWFRFP